MSLKIFNSVSVNRFEVILYEFVKIIPMHRVKYYLEILNNNLMFKDFN